MEIIRKNCSPNFANTQEQVWIEDSFKDDFHDTYAKLLHQDAIGKIEKVPSGKRSKNLSDTMQYRESQESTDVPKSCNTTMPVRYNFGDKGVCAFGNMANAMSLLGDERAARFFFVNRNKSMDLILEDHPEIKINTNGNKFMCAMLIARQKFGYVMHELDSHEPWTKHKCNQNVVKFVEIHPISELVTHAVCIHKRYIYDGSLEACLKLRKESFRWLAGNEEFFLKCYSLEASKN